ncbi:GIY-YIG nuclease family protein [Metallumcola ferriviriculae]|uniref:GIY-YIG nuclease family protein n=1 Tax=Metallumcola ferriviriculae TaxID=3039180 RepID=A0AAU0UKP0_9FIRM|nr:GIY-YIG nuclease family protein [Desulfitibacteraceae bacterium MK1]
MQKKAELKQIYKEKQKSVAGVYQIKNINNNKVFVGTSMNLKTMNGKRFELELGSHKNMELQDEWKEFGKEAFAFEVLETLEKKETGYLDAKDALKKLEEKWLNKVQPFGERGYNRKKPD